MEIDITIKNYRCFPETHPARITLKKGFIALVGINNSGKSSILKFFYEFRNLFEKLHSVSSVTSTMRGPQEILYPDTVFDPLELFSNTNSSDIVIEVSTMVSPIGTGQTTQATLVLTITRGTTNFISELKIHGNNISVDAISSADGIPQTTSNQETFNLNPIFVACTMLANTVYIGAFRNAINIGTNPDYYDIQVGQAFIEKWRVLKEGKSVMNRELAIKITNDIRDIFGYETLEINPSDDDHSLTINANQKSYKLHELGAGISQFIMVLVSATLKTPAFILVDEPEINLHPSLQLDFLTTLASYASEGIIYSTHSIGLARASADEILSVKRLNEGVSEVALYDKTSDLSVFIGELSYSNYSQLGFEKILLVEGVTEVKCIQQFLRKYKMDHKIVLVPLGGSQFIGRATVDELLEIKRITTDIHVLIDSERGSETEVIDKSRESFKEKCEKAEIQCHILERRATENYFTEEAIQTVMKSDKYHALEPYQKLGDSNPSWSKNENWRIAREMTKEDVDSTDLGGFLKSL